MVVISVSPLILYNIEKVVDFVGGFSLVATKKLSFFSWAKFKIPEFEPKNLVIGL